MVPQDGTCGFRKTLLLTPQDDIGLALGSTSHRNTGTHTPTHTAGECTGGECVV